jgi:hypothetical protein
MVVPAGMACTLFMSASGPWSHSLFEQRREQRMAHPASTYLWLSVSSGQHPGHHPSFCVRSDQIRSVLLAHSGLVGQYWQGGAVLWPPSADSSPMPVHAFLMLLHMKEPHRSWCMLG